MLERLTNSRTYQAAAGSVALLGLVSAPLIARGLEKPLVPHARHTYCERMTGFINGRNHTYAFMSEYSLSNGDRLLGIGYNWGQGQGFTIVPAGSPQLPTLSHAYPPGPGEYAITSIALVEEGGRLAVSGLDPACTLELIVK